MWYIFPQIAELGSSRMAKYFGIQSRAEAEAYIDHPILGPRLRTIVRAATNSGASVSELFPAPQFLADQIKFRACLTLFAIIDRETDAFSRALIRFEMQAHSSVLNWFRNEPTPPLSTRTWNFEPAFAPEPEPDTEAAPPPPPPPQAHAPPVAPKPKRKRAGSGNDEDIYSYGSDRSNEGLWEEMELEAVIDSRYRQNVLQYQVMWKFDPDDTRWYSAKNLRHAPLKLDAFHKANPDKEGPPKNIDIWRQYYFRGISAPRQSDDNQRL